MSDYNLRSSNIPINYKKNYYSFSDNPPMNKQYLFELTLYFKNNKKIIRKIEDNKYTTLIDIDDEINYFDIVNYEINVIEICGENNKSFEMFGNIDHYQSNFCQKDDNFYIEFSHNQNNFTHCKCYFIGIDFNTILISPPN